MGWTKDDKPMKDSDATKTDSDKSTQLEKLERIKNEIETQMTFLNMLVQFKDPFPSKDSPMPEIEKDKQKAIEYIKELKAESQKIIELGKKSQSSELTKEITTQIDEQIDSSHSKLVEVGTFIEKTIKEMQTVLIKINDKMDSNVESINTIKDRLSPKTTIFLSLLIGFIASLTASVVFTYFVQRP